MPYMDLAAGLTCEYKLEVHDGRVTLGPVTILEPILADRVNDGRLAKGGARRVYHIPDIIRNVIGKEIVPMAYDHKEANVTLCRLFGPGFPRRWNYANLLAFEKPLKEIVGQQVFREDCLWWPSGKHKMGHWLWLWGYRDLLPQVAADGYAHFLPLMRLLDVEMNDQPVRRLSKFFSKAGWKHMCAQSPSRILRVAWHGEKIHLCSLGTWGQNAHRRGAASVEAYRHHLASVVEQLSYIPTSLIGKGKDEGMPSDPKILRFIATMAKSRPWPLNKMSRYGRMAHMWGYILRRARQDLPESAYHWSPRRVEEEHRVAQDIERAARRVRILANQLDAETEFSLYPQIPRYVSDVDTRYVARLLVTKLQYHDQGENQNHCVGTYGAEGATLAIYTYSIERPDGEVLSTVMFNRQGAVLQQYGHHNVTVTDDQLLEFSFRVGRVLLNIWEDPEYVRSGQAVPMRHDRYAAPQIEQ